MRTAENHSQGQAAENRKPRTSGKPKRLAEERRVCMSFQGKVLLLALGIAVAVAGETLDAYSSKQWMHRLFSSISTIGILIVWISAAM